MANQWSRRGFLSAAGGAGLLAAAGCSSQKPAAGTPAGGPVTIKHMFGETVLASPPRRVVSAGYTEQDDLLAVGVVPIAVTNWFGSQPFAVWPWATDKLGDAKPAVLNLDNGIAVEAIAGLKPDLIVATNAGLDAQTYQKLSAIAPTIAQSGGDAFFEPWRTQARTIGQAVFQEKQMTSIIDAVDAGFVAIGKQYPQFNAKAVLLLQGQLRDDNVLAIMPSWRTEFLTKMGLVIAGSITPFAAGDHAVIPRKQLKDALDAADVLIWTTESPAEQAALLADPDVAALQATAQNRNIFTTKDQAGAIAFASPLSYQLVADQLPPVIAKALG